MKLRWSLSQKALGLVVIPLAFQLVFIGILGFLLKQVEMQAMQSERSKAIVMEANSLSKLIYDAMSALVLYNIQKSPLLDSYYQTTIKQIPEELVVLRRLCEGDPQRINIMNDIDATARKGLDLLSSAKHRADTSMLPISLSSKEPMHGEIDTTARDLIDQIQKLISAEKQIQAANPEAEAHTRTALEWFLLGAVFANIALAVVLTILYNRSTSSRLQALMDNTLRFARGETLLPQIKGMDEITHLDATFRDVVAARRQAEQFKQEFLEMVSHDVRTPLMSVSAAMDLLQAGVYGPIPDRANADLTIATRNITQVVNLMNELLDVHRMEAGKFELVCEEIVVGELIESAVDTVRARAEQVGLSIEETGDLDAQIYADSPRILQVIINLLSNAIKYSPRGASITVAVAAHEHTTEIKVIDRGKGIPAEFVDKIFDRYQQVHVDDARVKGGKVGLAICKSIVEEHGGKIGVQSVEGQGCTMWIELPNSSPAN